jgi:hypothetical protein
MDLWLLMLLVLVASIGCMLMGVRLRRGKWATLMVGLLLLAIFGFLAFLQVIGGD